MLMSPTTTSTLRSQRSRVSSAMSGPPLRFEPPEHRPYGTAGITRAPAADGAQQPRRFRRVAARERQRLLERRALELGDLGLEVERAGRDLARHRRAVNQSAARGHRAALQDAAREVGEQQLLAARLVD